MCPQGWRYPCRSERGPPQLSLQLEELLSRADPVLESVGRPGENAAAGAGCHTQALLLRRFAAMKAGGQGWPVHSGCLT